MTTLFHLLPRPERASRRLRRPAAAALSVSCCLLVAGLVLTALPARSGTLDVKQIQETVFKNGLRLVVKEAHATELASLQVWVRAGGFREDEETAGTAHVIEHLVFKGSEGGTPGMLDDEIENLGGLLEASTEKDWTRFGCTVAGRYVGKAITAVADALRKPRFKQEDFDAEKPLIAEEVSEIATKPDNYVLRGLYQVAFQKHPYRYDVRGGPQFLKNLKLDAVKAYYRKYYIPSNMTVVVIGDVDRAGVERAVRTAFQADEAAPPATEGPLAAPEAACETPRSLELPSPFTNAYVGFAFPAPSVKDDPETYAMDVLLTILEHGGRGRLPAAVKETAAVDALYETRRQPGLFTVVAATSANEVGGVRALLAKELEFIASHPIPESEVQLAKRELRGSFILDNETYAGQASTLGYYASIDRWQFGAEYLSHVQTVTAEQVQACAHKYINFDHAVSLVLRPRGGPMPVPQRGT